MGPEHTETFDTIKKINSSPILKYYDPSKLPTLQTDASLKGLVAVLLQEAHQIYFDSKILQPHQKTYDETELESLAVAAAMERFDHFKMFDKRF